MFPKGSPAGLRALEGANHLDQALELVLGIAKRYKGEKRPFSDSELEKMRQIGAMAGACSASGHSFAPVIEVEKSRMGETSTQDRPHPDDLSPTKEPPSPLASSTGSLACQPLHRADSSVRISALFGKLGRGTTKPQQPHSPIETSKANLQLLADITIQCAAAGADIKAVVGTVKRVLGDHSPPLNVDIFVMDVSGESVVDHVAREAVYLTETAHPVITTISSKAPAPHDGSYIFPLISKDATVGAVRINGVSSSDVEDSHLSFLTTLMTTITICIRNAMLIKSVKWQVDKAEAMLMMANQLSRDNLDERVLVQSIMQTAKQLTESDRCSIFIVNGTVLHAYFEDGKSVTMSIESGIAGHVAKTGETVNIREAYEDARFNSAVDKATGYRTKSILCMPVYYEGSIVAVAQLINKRPKVGKTGEITRVFNKRDEELFVTFSTFAGVSLRNCRINANLLREKRKSEAVLNVVQMLSDTDIRDVNQIVSHVMLGAKKLLNADRSSLFLIDKERDELYSKVADSTGGKEIRFKSGRGIAGTVASSGIAENIPDAYEDERFNREVDKAFNYRTRSILCEPITCKGEVLAVAQLVNRIDEDSGEVVQFSKEDEDTFRTFSLFAGISISNSHLLEFAINAGREAMALNERRGDPGLGQRRPSSAQITLRPIEEEEKEPIRVLELPTVEFTSKNFDFFGVREVSDNPLNSAVAVVLRVMMSTGLPQKFKCPEDVLLTFVCQCRRRYRNVPYHNFFHAVDACQTVHTFLYEGRVCELLTELECFVLMITALVHDLDHMGLNNSFHLKTDSPLGILSSASGNNSVLEVHHCNLAIEILEDSKSNVFIGLTPEELKWAYRGMIDCVLATDMAKHGELSKAFEEMKLSKEDENDRRMVMEMVMKAADISNVTKPFEVSRKWAMAVTEEFYQQGDKERAKGVDVLPMFDRTKNNELAKGQIGFISFIALKFFRILADKLPGLRWTVENIEANKQRWSQQLEARRASTLKQAEKSE